MIGNEKSAIEHLLQRDTGLQIMSRVWEGQLLRVTCFTPSSFDLSQLSTLWQTVVGENPEIDEARPRDGFRSQGGGIGESLSLEIQTQPGRVDWLVGSRTTEGRPPRSEFGPVLPVIDELNRFVIPWLDSGEVPFTRIAFGEVLVTPVADRESGYEAVMELVPSVKFDARKGVSDFLFQLNRPTQSKHAEIQLNRLMKWSVARQQSFRLTVSAGGPPVPTNAKENYFVRLELDLSTPAVTSQEALEPKLVMPIFKELQALGKEISERGELA